jgi:hypothetical protein
MTDPTLFDILPKRTHKAYAQAHGIQLNPTVQPEDEERLSAQAERLLALFQQRRREGLTVHTGEMRDIACQYNARLYEIRRRLVKEGLCVDLVKRIPGTGINHYRIVPLAESKFYAAHRERLNP